MRSKTDPEILLTAESTEVRRGKAEAGKPWVTSEYKPLFFNFRFWFSPKKSDSKGFSSSFSLRSSASSAVKWCCYP
jgi:hypothetical protein